MSHALPIPDLHEKKTPNASFWSWLKGESALFISQIATVLGLVLYFASLFYYIGGGHSNSAHHEATEKYLTTADTIILYANMAAALLFIIILIQIYNKNDHGQYHVTVVSKTLLGITISDEEINKGIKTVKKFKGWFLVYWFYALVFFLVYNFLFDLLKEDDLGRFSAIILNSFGPIILFQCFKIIRNTNANAKIKKRWLSVINDGSIGIVTIAYLCILAMVATSNKDHHFIFDERLNLWGNICSCTVNMVVIATLISRIDSKLIGIPSLLISLICGYAVIQPLLIYFNDHQIAASLTFFLAFIFKVYFFSVLTYAMQTGRLLNYFCLNSRLSEEINPTPWDIGRWINGRLAFNTRHKIKALLILVSIGIGGFIYYASILHPDKNLFGYNRWGTYDWFVIYISGVTMGISVYFCYKLTSLNYNNQQTTVEIIERFKPGAGVNVFADKCGKGVRLIAIYFGAFWISIAMLYAVIVWSKLVPLVGSSSSITPVYYMDIPLQSSLETFYKIQNSNEEHYKSVPLSVFGIRPPKAHVDTASSFYYSKEHVYDIGTQSSAVLPVVEHSKLLHKDTSSKLKIHLEALSSRDKAILFNYLKENKLIKQIIVSAANEHQNAPHLEEANVIDYAIQNQIFDSKIIKQEKAKKKVQYADEYKIDKNIATGDTIMFANSFFLVAINNLTEQPKRDSGLTSITYQYKKLIDSNSLFFDTTEFVLNNLSMLFLFFCFVEFYVARNYTEIALILSNRHSNILSGIKQKIMLFGALVFVMLTVIYVLVVATAIKHYKSDDLTEIRFIFNIVSGLLNGIVFCLIIGRLDSKFMQLPNWVVMLLFIYPALQPMFAGLSKDTSILHIALTAAFFCKLFFFVVIYNLITTGRVFRYLYHIPFASKAVDAVYQNYFEFVVEKNDVNEKFSFVVKKSGKVVFRTETHSEHKKDITNLIRNIQKDLEKSENKLLPADQFGNYFITYKLPFAENNRHHKTNVTHEPTEKASMESIEFRTAKQRDYFSECAMQCLPYCKVSTDI